MNKSGRLEIRHYCFGQWYVEIMPEDGARLRRLAYQQQDLLTAPPRSFRPPRHYNGLYEKRPVYGYDDCFPTVTPCLYPAGNLKLPDHGEIYRLKADCFAFENGLKCVFISKLLPVVFERQMIFCGNRLVWIFSVINLGRKAMPFLHVMHPLMPVSKVMKIDLPDFDEIVEEPSRQKVKLQSATDAENFLLSSPSGRAYMFLLRGVQNGFFKIHFRTGLMLDVIFERALFPTLGIWWNKSGFPEEKGLGRDECALEPIPGDWSSLYDASRTGNCLSVPAGRTFMWRIEWQVRTLKS